jgi:iron(III) transport system permease protein
MDIGAPFRRAPRFTRWLSELGGAHAWQLLLFAVMVLALAVPLGLLVLGSFSTAKLPGDIDLASLTLENYRAVWGNPATYAVFSNTLIYAGGAVAIGVPMALSLAFLVERTDLPLKMVVYAGVTLCIAMPGMLQSMAYVLMFSPKIGFINKLLMAAFGLDNAPLNIYSLPGMAIVESLRLVPTAFLMMVPLLRSMDSALEDAAATSGARPLSTIRRVTARLMLPGIIAVLIYQLVSALEVFEVPSILGMPAGIYVFSTRIYAILHAASSLPDYGKADALGILYLFVAVAMTVLYLKVIGKAERYSIVTGKGYRPRLMMLGLWRWVAFGLVGFYLLMAIILPFLVLVYISFIPFLQVPSEKAFKMFSWNNYRTIFDSDLIGHVVSNTLIMTATVATMTVVLSFLISLVVVRSKFWGRKLLDQLVFMPHAIPGMVMGLAFLWLFLKIDQTGLPIFGSIWSMAIAFTLSFVAYGTRSMNAAILQIHRDLEEAALINGARHWRAFWRVFVPLLMPSIAGLWIWAVLHAVRVAGLPLILFQGQRNQVLAVLIWNMWTDGEVGSVGALATMLILVLLTITLLLRAIGFRRNHRI